jgi:hypothetical protein
LSEKLKRKKRRRSRSTREGGRNARKRGEKEKIFNADPPTATETKKKK